MHYLWIKEDDSKAFKSFLSGNEIEVGLYVNSTQPVVNPGKEIEIFYGEDTTDTYRAEVKRQHFVPPTSQSGKSFLTLSLVKI
jgi:hypothetical protein